MFSPNNLPISVFAQHGKSSERTIEESDHGLFMYVLNEGITMCL